MNTISHDLSGVIDTMGGLTECRYETEAYCEHDSTRILDGNSYLIKCQMQRSEGGGGGGRSKKLHRLQNSIDRLAVKLM